MKFSIVTTALNSQHTIADTLNSVKDQTWSNIEHIIVDGASEDGTLDVVNQFPHVAKVTSGTDAGIYDAMNKGIELATGDVLLFLNSDDYYAHSKVIQLYFECFEKLECDSVYSDLDYVTKNDKRIVRRWVSGGYRRKKFLSGWMPPHPTFAVKLKYLKMYGGFDTRFTSAADYELMLRLLYKNRISAGYVKGVSVKMRVGGKSNASFKSRLIAHQEDRKAWRVNEVRPKIYSLSLKPLRKVNQFLAVKVRNSTN